MPKTNAKPKKRICPTCGGEMTYSRKLRKLVCEACLYGAFLTDQAQRESVKRYRQTDKGREAEKKYEQSKKGKTARERYLKSEKYKQRRREYNQRLKESLAIARAAELERAKKITTAEATAADEQASLIQDIREYIDLRGHTPSPEDVKTWADTEYNLRLTVEQARELTQRAQKH